jgi:hypothetical protein
MFTKQIDWDTFRDICKYRDRTKCNAKEFCVTNCSQSNRGAMNKCGFWKLLKNPSKEEKVEKFTIEQKKRFEWSRED